MGLEDNIIDEEDDFPIDLGDDEEEKEYQEAISKPIPPSRPKAEKPSHMGSSSDKRSSLRPQTIAHGEFSSKNGDESMQDRLVDSLVAENRNLKRLLAKSRLTVKHLQRELLNAEKRMEAFVDEKLWSVEQEKNVLKMKISELERTNEDTKVKESRMKDEITKLKGEKKRLDGKISRIRQDRAMSIQFASKRGNIIKEFYFTEKTYVTCLTILKDQYIDEIEKRKLLPSKLHSEIFADFGKVYVANKVFLRKLEESVFCRTSDEILVGLVLNFSANFKMVYSSYIKMYSKNHQLLSDYIQSHKKFEKFLNATSAGIREKDSAQESQIASLMIMPIQRLPRYKLLLQSLVKYTVKKRSVGVQAKKSQFEKLHEAIRVIQDILKFCNEESKKNEERIKLIQLSKDLNLTLIQKTLVFSAEIVKRKRGDSFVPSSMFILDDVFVYQDQKNKKKKKGGGILKKRKVEEIPVNDIHMEIVSGKTLVKLKFWKRELEFDLINQVLLKRFVTKFNLIKD